MSQRVFSHSRIVEDGRPFSSSVIACHKCGDTATFVHRNNAKRMAPDGVTQYFRNHGWIVGNRPNGDLCPMCITAGKRRHLQLVPGPKEEEMKIELPVAEPPRHMSRDDRRIINEKLDGIYADEAYVFPWNDAKVARDLGVPQAWVSEVRDAFFGPAGSNPEIDAFLEKLEPMKVEAEGYVREAKALSEQVNAKLLAAQKLVQATSNLTARVVELEQLAAKLRKETGK